MDPSLLPPTLLHLCFHYMPYTTHPLNGRPHSSSCSCYRKSFNKWMRTGVMSGVCSPRCFTLHFSQAGWQAVTYWRYPAIRPKREPHINYPIKGDVRIRRLIAITPLRWTGTGRVDEWLSGIKLLPLSLNFHFTRRLLFQNIWSFNGQRKTQLPRYSPKLNHFPSSCCAHKVFLE